MVAKTMTGARAQLIISDPSTQTGKVVGIFNNVSWGLAYDAQPIYVMGRHSAAEIVYTAQEAVNISASGFRIVDSGAHVSAKVPQLQDLLTSEYMSLAIFDRQTSKMIAKMHSVVSLGYSTSITARGVQEISCNFMALLVDEENIENAEKAGASDLS